GIDLGDKNSEICVFDEDGEVSKRLRLRMKEAEFQCYFASIPRSAVAIEAGAQSRWVADTVERCGHKVYVSNTGKYHISAKATTRWRSTSRGHGIRSTGCWIRWTG